MQDSSDWETSKENILPLSGGRRMSSLSQSLQRDIDPTSSLDLENELAFEKFEKDIETYDGSDPLQPWVAYISYFIQHRLNENVKYHEKSQEIMLSCVKKFMKEPIYKNDRRLTDIFLRALRVMPAARQINLIKKSMTTGVGLKVAGMYTTLAELYELNHDTRNALDSVREGLSQGAEPISVLKEHEKNLEFRVAAQLAESMKNEEKGKLADDVARLFGSQVPIDHSNEAVSIRVQLPRAGSSKAAPPATQKLQKVTVFADENGSENVNWHNQHASNDPVREISRINSESENKMHPTKWNAPGPKMVEVDVPTFERIEVYNDEESLPIIPKMPLPGRVLADKKIDSDSSTASSLDDGYGTSASVVSSVLPSPFNTAPGRTYTIPFKTELAPLAADELNKELVNDKKGGLKNKFLNPFPWSTIPAQLVSNNAVSRTNGETLVHSHSNVSNEPTPTPTPTMNNIFAFSSATGEEIPSETVAKFAEQLARRQHKTKNSKEPRVSFNPKPVLFGSSASIVPAFPAPATSRSVSDSRAVFNQIEAQALIVESKTKDNMIPQTKAKEEIKTPSIAAESAANPNTDVNIKSKQMYKSDKLLCKGREVSFEELRAQAFLQALAARNAEYLYSNFDNEKKTKCAPEAEAGASISSSNHVSEVEALRTEFQNLRHHISVEVKSLSDQSKDVKTMEIETLRMEIANFKNEFRKEMNACSVERAATSKISRELHCLRSELQGCKALVAKEGAKTTSAIEIGQTNADQLETLRKEIRDYKERNCELETTVQQLRTTLDAACTQWAITMQKATLLEDEVAALKLKHCRTGDEDIEQVTNTNNAQTQAQVNQIPEKVQVQQHSDLPARAPRKTYVVSHEGDENAGVHNALWKRHPQNQNNDSFNVSFHRQPLTTLARNDDVEETCHDDEEMIIGDEATVFVYNNAPNSEMTGAIFNRNENFNVTNLTTALKFHPKPIFCSSPGGKSEKESDEDLLGLENEEVILHMPNLPHHRLSNPYPKRNTFNQTMEDVAHNLSTIQETSKERSSTSGSSSSSNMTAFGFLRSNSYMHQIRPSSNSGGTRHGQN